MANFTADDFVRLVTLYAPEVVNALAFSPDGSLLAVGSGDKVHIFSVPPEARPPQNAVPAGSASPNRP